jgi:hypothetical protein
VPQHRFFETAGALDPSQPFRSIRSRKALDEGEKVQAKVTVKATDAAGNEATAKRTIKLVK